MALGRLTGWMRGAGDGSAVPEQAAHGQAAAQGSPSGSSSEAGAGAASAPVHDIVDRALLERALAATAVMFVLAFFFSPLFGGIVLGIVTALTLSELGLARALARRGVPAWHRDAGWRGIVAQVIGPMTLAFQSGALWVLERPEMRVVAVLLVGLLLVQAARIRRGPWIVRSGMLPFATLGLLSFFDLASGQAPGTAAGELGLVLLAAALWTWGGVHRGALPALGPGSWLPAGQAAGDPDDAARFVATVGHELRTPLNGIIGMTEGLLAGELAREQRDRALVIAEAGRSLTALLNDLLDHSRIEAGRLDIHPVTESFHAGLRHIVSLYAPVAEKKGLTLRLERDAEVPDWLEHDPVRVRQCISNLVSNALKFTEEGGVTLHVRVARPVRTVGRPVEILATVTDTGIGLGGAGADVLFEPFVQSRAAAILQVGGTGLGLSIARRLARRMGGDIVARDAPEGGAEFTFRFRAPLAEAPPRHAFSDLADVTAENPAQTGLRVLIVDDIATNRAVARLFLRPLGVHAVDADSGEAAVALLKRERFDAVLLDLRMPGMGGEALVRLIRAGKAGPRDLPVIAATADDRVELRLMKASGFDGLVLKPLDQRALQASIMSVVAARLVAPDPGDDAGGLGTGAPDRMRA